MFNSKKTNKINPTSKAVFIISLFMVSALLTLKINAQDTPKDTPVVYNIIQGNGKSSVNDNTNSVDYLKFKNPSSLEIRGTMTAIPQEIFNLTSLEELNVNAAGITSLPPDIKNLINLTVLNLGNTSINELPKEISQLMHLKEIHLPFVYWVFRINEVKKITNASVILE